MSGRRRSRRRRSAVGMGVAFVAALLALGARPGTGPSAYGQEGEGDSGGEGDAADVRVEVVGGFDGIVAPGRPYPVVVTVEAQRLVRGELRVTVPTETGTIDLEQPIEVAGGNTERFWLLAPSGVDHVQLRATVLDDGERVGGGQGDLRFELANEVVGTIPDGWQFHSATSYELAVGDMGSALLQPVEPEVFDLGAPALEPLDQLLIQPDQLEALSDEHRTAVTTWVGRGGHLVVTTDDPALLEGLVPEEWMPAPGDGARAGLGQVRLVGEDWAGRLLPTPTRSTYEEEIIASDLTSTVPLSQSLAQRARLRLPSATGLVLLLVGYVLVLGPLAFIGARLLRRRQLTWVAVPVLSLVFTGIVFGVESRVTTPRGSAQVTIYETGPGGTVATTWSLLTAHREGDVGLDLPAGWTATPTADFGMVGFGPPVDFGGGAPALPFRVETGGDGAGEAVADPPTGGFAMVTASGPAPDMDEALVVTARSEADGSVVGTVQNQLDVPLHHVVALVGRAGYADIGTLDAGEERDFEVADATQFVWGGPQPEFTVWPADPTGGPFGVPGGGGGIIVGPEPEPEPAPVPIAPEITRPTVPDEVPDETDDARAEALEEAGVVVDESGAVVSDEFPAGATEVIVVPPDTWFDPDPEAERARAIEFDDAMAEAAVAQAEAEAEAVVAQEAAAEAPTEADADTVVVPAAWSTLMHQVGYNYRPQGQVVVVGWTDELPPPLETRSGTTDVAWSSSAVVARATALPAAGRLTDTATVRSNVRGPGTQSIPITVDEDSADPQPLMGLTGMVFGFDLPAGVDGRPVDTSRLVINPSNALQQLEIWTTTDGWRLLDTPESGQAEVPVPQEAVVEGTVYLRAGVSTSVVPESGRDLVIYEVPGP